MVVGAGIVDAVVGVVIDAVVVGVVIVDAVVLGVVTLEPLVRGQKVEKRPDEARETGSGEKMLMMTVPIQNQQI